MKIRDLCLAEGLNFWMVGGNLYELRDKNDRMNVGIQAVQAEWLADSIRDNVKRGIDLAAEAGRMHGKVTYGYRRIYHQRTKALVRPELDDEPREALGVADGSASTYSPAGIVKEIFMRVGGQQGEPHDGGVPVRAVPYEPPARLTYAAPVSPKRRRRDVIVAVDRYVNLVKGRGQLLG